MFQQIVEQNSIWQAGERVVVRCVPDLAESTLLRRYVLVLNKEVERVDFFDWGDDGEGVENTAVVGGVSHFADPGITGIDLLCYFAVGRLICYCTLKRGGGFADCRLFATANQIQIRLVCPDDVHASIGHKHGRSGQ